MKYNKKSSPSVGVTDSQIIKTTDSGASERGFNEGKKRKGRKKACCCRYFGLLLLVLVHCANEHDGKAAY